MRGVLPASPQKSEMAGGGQFADVATALRYSKTVYLTAANSRRVTPTAKVSYLAQE
jgi:hypothetical protein